MEVDLKGILRFEYSPFAKGGGRTRVVFYAEPKDCNAALKTKPNYESIRAQWFSYGEFKSEFMSVGGVSKLRGSEPVQWFTYLNEGKTIYPPSMLSMERYN